MLNLVLALIPMPERPSGGDDDPGVVGKLILWGRRHGRYRRAPHELRRLDDRDLDDLGIGRADLPEMAWRHATGAAPVMRPYR